MNDKDERLVVQIGNVRIVRGDSWWGGSGGMWALRGAVLLLALAWLTGVVVVTWTVWTAVAR